jgi:hypothetical protein
LAVNKNRLGPSFEQLVPAFDALRLLADFVDGYVRQLYTYPQPIDRAVAAGLDDAQALADSLNVGAGAERGQVHE